MIRKSIEVSLNTHLINPVGLVLDQQSSNGSTGECAQGASKHSTESNGRNITTTLGRELGKHTDLVTKRTDVGESTEGIGGDETRTRRKIFILGAHKIIVGDELVGDQLEADELSDLVKITIPGNSEEECDRTAHVSKNKLQRQWRIVDVQISTDPSEESIDQTNERDDSK